MNNAASADLSRELWNPKAEDMPREVLRGLQLDRLKEQVAYNYQRSEVHRRKFDAVGAHPADIKTFADFTRIPLMTKDEHRQVQEEGLASYGDPSHSLRCADRSQIVRINATSGTTGTPTLYTLTQHDVNIVNEMHARKYWRAGIRPGDVMIQALSLSMFTGGLPLSQGIMNLGACVVPVGIEGGTKRVLEMIKLTRPAAIVATPSFGKYLIEETPRLMGKDPRELGLRYFFCAGEGGGGEATIRHALAEGFGAKVFDHTGGGHAFHGISCECADQVNGAMHFVSEDHCLLELVDPETHQALEMADGVTGEMVFTFLDWRGGPFMRYALGDLIQVWTTPCVCGRPGIRFKILGRCDDMLTIKGVNVYPQAIAGLIARFKPQVTGEFRIQLDAPGPMVQPPLKILIEHAGLDPEALETLERTLLAEFRESLRVAPAFEWVSPGSIPRQSGKTRLIEVRRGNSLSA